MGAPRAGTGRAEARDAEDGEGCARERALFRRSEGRGEGASREVGRRQDRARAGGTASAGAGAPTEVGRSRAARRGASEDEAQGSGESREGRSPREAAGGKGAEGGESGERSGHAPHARTPYPPYPRCDPDPGPRAWGSEDGVGVEQRTRVVQPLFDPLPTPTARSGP